jgi:hypothetical protein
MDKGYRAFFHSLGLGLQRISGADDSPDAGAGYDVDADLAGFQNFQHADVSQAAGTPAAESQTDSQLPRHRENLHRHPDCWIDGLLE